MNLTTLENICEVNPRLASAVRQQKSLPVSYVPMSDVLEDGFIQGSTPGVLGNYVKGYTYFERGDVLVAKITPCMENGKAAYVENNFPTQIGFGSTEFHVLRPGPGVDPKYLFYMLWNDRFRKVAETNMTGSAGQKRVPTNFIRSWVIPLPSLEEQRRIATILDKADALRRKRQESLALMDEFLRSVFLEMFGDPVVNPRGWEILKVGSVSEVQGGLTKSTKKRQNYSISVPYLRVANVYRNKLDLAEIKELNVTETELERTLLQPEDLLLVEGHGNPKEVGRTAMWDGSIAQCVHQNHIIRLRVDGAVATPSYVCAYINSSGGRRQLFKENKTTSGLNTISIRQVRELSLPLPPLELQQDYLRIYNKIEQNRLGITSSLNQLDLLFKSLNQRAFRGEL